MAQFLPSMDQEGDRAGGVTAKSTAFSNVFFAASLREWQRSLSNSEQLFREFNSPCVILCMYLSLCLCLCLHLCLCLVLCLYLCLWCMSAFAPAASMCLFMHLFLFLFFVCCPSRLAPICPPLPLLPFSTPSLSPLFRPSLSPLLRPSLSPLSPPLPPSLSSIPSLPHPSPLPPPSLPFPTLPSSPTLFFLPHSPLLLTPSTGEFTVEYQTKVRAEERKRMIEAASQVNVKTPR